MEGHRRHTNRMVRTTRNRNELSSVSGRASAFLITTSQKFLFRPLGSTNPNPTPSLPYEATRACTSISNSEWISGGPSRWSDIEITSPMGQRSSVCRKIPFLLIILTRPSFGAETLPCMATSPDGARLSALSCCGYPSVRMANFQSLVVFTYQNLLLEQSCLKGQ